MEQKNNSIVVDQRLLMEFVAYSGEAKSNAILALQAYKNNEFDKSKKLMDEADSLIINAGKKHFEILKKSSKDKIEINLLMLHAEDHYNSAQTIILLNKEIIELHSKINKK